MKQTLLLTTIEKAAWTGVMERVVRARQALQTAQGEAEEIANEIIAQHKAPPLKKGATITGAIVDGRTAIVYDATLALLEGPKPEPEPEEEPEEAPPLLGERDPEPAPEPEEALAED